MAQKIDTIRFNGMRSCAEFNDCKALYPILGAVLRDWPFELVTSRTDPPPVIRVGKTSAGYKRQSSWLAQPVVFNDTVDTVCDFIVDLIHSYIADHENYLCLHGAAVELKPGLMVFPNTYRVGKSLLSLKLVSRGARLFSDDALPVSGQDNSGNALGILPRLRLPLPDSIGQAFRDFIDHRIGPQNARYRYVNLDESKLVKRGTKAPVTAITVLYRGDDLEPSLRPAKKSDVVREMILRNFARQNPAIDILDRIHNIVDQADCFSLTYDTLNQAAELLEEALGITPA